MKVKDLINFIPEIISITGPTEASVKSITETSTETKMGTLFVAIQGDSYDGHDFICDALSRGASAVIGEKAMVLDDRAYIRVKNSRKALAASAAWFYGCPGDKLKIIGVTGTSGKTTTTYLIHAMQKESGVRSGIIGTLGYVINSEKIPATYTTPGPLCLNRLFKRMLEENLDSVVMEVSSHSLKLHRVEGIKYEVGLFTNLTQDHLDFHKTFDDYFHSKQKLFQQSKYAVINVDDENGEELAGSMNIPVWSYGINKNSDFMAKNIHITAKGVAYDLVFKKQKTPGFLSCTGLFSVYNSLAALATCTVLNYPLENSIRALKKIKGISGRFELIKNNKGINVIVDYAHKPDGLKNVLLTIKGFGTGRIITVFGCGGDRDKEKRHMMGEISSRLSDYTIITSDNPRSEDPRTIIEQIEAGIIGDNYEKIIDRRKAIQRAILMAQKSDTVLIAGKGHENYQIIGDRRIHFDDREVAKEFLNKEGRQMRALTVKEVTEVTKGELIGSSNTAIAGVSTDSRTIESGDLFMPLKGPNFDGHDYIKQAFKKGAVASLCNKNKAIKVDDIQNKTIIFVNDVQTALLSLASYYRKLFDIPFIVVTGSVGKTTTKEMIAQILKKRFNVLKNEGNLNNEIGVPLTLFQLNDNHQIGVIELGMSDLGEIHRLTNVVKPKIVVITNIGVAHIGKLGSKKNIAEAKFEAVRLLGKDDLAVLNGDCFELWNPRKDITPKTVFFGLKRGDITAKSVKFDNANGLEFDIDGSYGRYTFKVSLAGMHNVSNALAAIVVSLEIGLTKNEIRQGLQNISLPKMRLQFKKSHTGADIIDDTYNASPDSMKAALDVLNQNSGNKKRAVIVGDMLELGRLSEDFHREIGKYAADKTDVFIAVGKFAQYYKEGVLEGQFDNQCIYTFPSVQSTIQSIKEIVKDYNIILIKGSRGAKMEKITQILVGGS